MGTLRRMMPSGTGERIRPFVAAMFVAAVACLLSGASASAATIQVTTSADENGGNGLACSLREAVLTVNGGTKRPDGCVATGDFGMNDTITFAASTDGSPILLSNGLITITHNVQVIGNGASKTIVDANHATGVLQVDSGITVGISGLTIRNGSATNGAGVNNFADLTVTESTLSGNSASGTGGGIYGFTGSTLTIANSILSGNSAVFGGGIAHAGATLTVTNSALSANSASTQGGGIYSSVGTVTVTESVLNGNSAGFSGGGISSGSGTLTVTNSTLSGNSTQNGSGGGIENQGTLIVTSSTLSDNTAFGSGGGVFSFGGTLTVTVTDSTLSGNSAVRGAGAGIYSNSGTLTVTNSTLSGNSSSQRGGGIRNGSGTLTLTSSTLSGNSSSEPGGGISNSGTASLRASVLDTGATGRNCAGNINSLGSNVADDTSCSLTATGDQQVAEGGILLGPLADNGGPTKTHALLGGSPAIDAVHGLCTSNGQASGAMIITDQRGRTRPNGARCDAGAHEFFRGTLAFSAPTFAAGEGDGNATITVTRTGGSEGSVGATVSTANGAAVAPGDYTATTPTVSFADGDATSKTVSITIVDDSLKEANETVTLTLGSPTGGVALGPQASATLTIIDNDPTPSVSIANVSVTEGNAGQTSTATFTATLSNPSTLQITVAYATANGTATAGSDFTATGGTLTFAPGETSKTIPVSVQGDTAAESDEAFTVTLSNPTNATLGASHAIGTIQNDDVTTACGPRPRVTQTVTASGGVLNVHVEATPLNTAGNNRVLEIRFGMFQNASVTLNGQSASSGQTVSLPANSVAADFTVRRVAAGQTTTVPFTVVDTCGEWSTFVGGGAGAGF